MWQCPLCRSPIDISASVIQCSNNHTFDRAKAGYVNLLPVQFKKSKSPGDDKNMVRARREFHQLNGYEPLKNTMITMLSRYFTEDKTYRIYDAGCGEGSYLNALVEGITNNGVTVEGAGSDIAKIAVELAAKAFKKHQFVVASSFDLPIATGSQDAIIQVFAPGCSKEYARVLTHEGILLTVDPAPLHLFELKSLIYDNPEPHEVENETRAGFAHCGEERVNYRLDFDNDAQKIALIKMTPYYWRLSSERLTNIVNALNYVTVDFRLQCWQRVSTQIIDNEQNNL